MSIRSHPSFDEVMKDVVEGLRASFSPRDADESESFRVSHHFDDDDGDAIGNDRVLAVPWSYNCVHTGDFQCLFPTGREIQIDGVTLADYREGDLMLHRYVDWGGVIVQLGLEVSGRIAVTEDEYAFGRALI